MEEEKKVEEKTAEEEAGATISTDQASEEPVKEELKEGTGDEDEVEDEAQGGQGDTAEEQVANASTVDAGEDTTEANADEERLAAEWESALEEEAKEGKAPDFADLDRAKGKTGTPKDLEFILDIPLEVTVEMGRTKMLVNDLLQMGQGSIIELSRLAGEPFDILVNNKLIARGEVVVVNEKFGVRITDIVSPMERVKRLG